MNNNEEIQGFNLICVERLKAGQFFFFPNGHKRMVAEDVRVGIAWTTIKATSPTGRTYKKDIINCTKIQIYA